MCSLIMPADYDVIVAHSPPVFSHSPPSSFYSYGSCRSVSNPPSPLASRRLSPSPQRRLPPSSPKPRRPCLVINKPDDSSSGSENDNDLASPTKLKKKVVFADDRGLSLTHVSNYRFINISLKIPISIRGIVQNALLLSRRDFSKLLFSYLVIVFIVTVGLCEIPKMQVL